MALNRAQQLSLAAVLALALMATLLARSGLTQNRPVIFQKQRRYASAVQQKAGGQEGGRADRAHAHRGVALPADAPSSPISASNKPRLAACDVPIGTLSIRSRPLEPLLQSLEAAGAKACQVFVFEDLAGHTGHREDAIYAFKSDEYTHVLLNTTASLGRICKQGDASCKALRLIGLYRLMLDNLFNLGYEHAIILEDDLVVSPDFLDFFRATLPLVSAQNRVCAVSAWVDNSFAGVVSQSSLAFASQVVRVSHFGGLGWATSKAQYTKWIKGGWGEVTHSWDGAVSHMMLQDGCDTIAPRISRTRHTGTTAPRQSSTHALAVASSWATGSVQFDVSHVQTPASYSASLMQFLETAVPVQCVDELISMAEQDWSGNRPPRTYALFINGTVDTQWSAFVRKWGLWEGRPMRGSWRGVLPLRIAGAELLIVQQSEKFFQDHADDLRQRQFPSVLYSRALEACVSRANITLAVTALSRLAPPRTSCRQACASERLVCYEQAMHFLRCGVNCSSTDSEEADGSGPTNGPSCRCGSPRTFSCPARPPLGQQRHCLCQAVTGGIHAKYVVS